MWFNWGKLPANAPPSAYQRLNKQTKQTCRYEYIDLALDPHAPRSTCAGTEHDSARLIFISWDGHAVILMAFVAAWGESRCGVWQGGSGSKRFEGN